VSSIPTYIGDAFWVAGLAVMFSASTRASNRTAGDETLPIAGTSLPRWVALWALPFGAFAISLWFAYEARVVVVAPDMEFILLGLRALTASVLPIVHLRLLADAVKPPKR
jgi:hypothetical protein